MPIKSVAQYSEIDYMTLGDNTLVSGVSGNRIRVLAAVVVASGGANSIRFESGASGVSLTGFIDLAADGQLILPLNGHGWFEAAAGALLNLELSAGTLVGGCLVYELVE